MDCQQRRKSIGLNTEKLAQLEFAIFQEHQFNALFFTSYTYASNSSINPCYATTMKESECRTRWFYEDTTMLDTSWHGLAMGSLDKCTL